MIEMNEMKKVLTIAGSDCSGGAGIQADIKTITAHKMYAMSAITALTAQNTTGVYDILDAGADFVGRQLDCIFQDIYPIPGVSPEIIAPLWTGAELVLPVLLVLGLASRFAAFGMLLLTGLMGLGAMVALRRR